MAQNAPHVLDKLDLDMCSWIIRHKKCPSKGDVAMGIPKYHVHLQFNKHNTQCFLLSINSLNHSFSHCFYDIKCTNSLDRLASDVGDTNEL